MSVPPSTALPLYGVTDANGNLLIEPDSVIEADVDAGSEINTHPVEQGGFDSYNRVQKPIGIRLLMACQGKNMTRSEFLATLESLREGTQTVTVALLDAAYSNMVLQDYGYKRSAEHGAVTIWADTWWKEERSTNVFVTPPASSQPQGNAAVNLGSVQATTPTTQQQASVSNPPTTPAETPASYFGITPASGDAW